VDGAPPVALDRSQQRAAGQRAAEQQRDQRGERDARAQTGGAAHGRRRQPTPRTVCSMRGSPADSSLRRTYPTKTSTTLVSTSSRADRMQTGTSLPSSRRRRTTLTPSRSGIVTSSTTTDGGRRATASSAS